MKPFSHKSMSVWLSGLALSVPLGGCDSPTPPPPAPPPPAPTATAPPATTSASTPATMDAPPRQPAVPTPPRSAESPDTPPDDPTVARFLGLEAPKPATWLWTAPTKAMRSAEYIVPGEGRDDAGSIVVFHFGPNQGGTVDANIIRWQRQFLTDDDLMPDPIVTRHEADGMPVTIVELQGRFQEMGAPSFVPDRKAIQTIVESDVGHIFIRFVGPTATVEKNQPEFLEMILGLKRVAPDAVPEEQDE